MGMAKVLAFVNQKGGVGKTTSAVNLAAALQKAGKHVLLCDFDPQANATSGLGVEKSTAAHSTYDIVIEDFPAADAVIHTQYCDVLASNVALSGAGVELTELMVTRRAVKRRLNPTISIFGVLLTMSDGRTKYSAQVAEEVRRHFPGKVFASAIPRNVRLSEAPSHGMPVCAYDKFSRGATAYDAVAQEILAKEQ